MDTKYEAKLLKDFPEFFKHRDDIQASLMGFGFEIDNGWYDLLYKLCVDIQVQLIEEHGKVPDSFYVTQIKEKYARMVMYVSGASPEVFSLIDKAERKSIRICELCGKPGTTLCQTFWYKTLCPQCAKKKGFVICPKV